jgi:hypothetical protein
MQRRLEQIDESITRYSHSSTAPIARAPRCRKPVAVRSPRIIVTAFGIELRESEPIHRDQLLFAKTC